MKLTRFAATLLGTTALGLGLTGLPALAATGTGTVTAALTSPIAVSSSAVAAPMTCTANATAKVYAVRIQSAPVEGYTLAATISVKGYSGPGTYPATVTASLTGNGKAYGGAQKTSTVVISDTGGALQFAKTATGAKVPKAAGKTLSGSVSWVCPTA